MHSSLPPSDECRLRPDPDPRTHRSLEELQEGYQALPPSPRDQGRVALLMARLPEDRRWLPESVEVTCDGAFPGDRWGAEREARIAKYGEARYREMQLAVMQLPVAELIAHGQPLCLFGDNLFLDLDLSRENLPVGSQLRIGSTLLEVTGEPHDGCSLFRKRFGDAALRFTAAPENRDRVLRGIYLQVLEPGTLSVGDVVEVVSRGAQVR